MKIYKRMLLLLIISCLGISNSNAASVVLSGSELAGFDGIEVNGSFYDVRFVAGQYFEYQAPYGGTIYPTGIVFPTSATALDASTALLSAVQATSFDTNPASIVGCSAGTFCGMSTLWSIQGIGFMTLTAKNYTGAGDTISSIGWSASHDLGGPGLTEYVWAAWSDSVAVPLPSAVWLFGSVLTLLGLIRRRAR